MPKIKHLEQKFSIASYELIKECTPQELRFYLWLKLWAINKHDAFPSYKTIMDDLGMGSKSTLSHLISDMEKSGHLKIERTHRKNNIYDITWYDSRVQKAYSIGTETVLKGSTETVLQPVFKKTNRNITITADADSNKVFDLFKEIRPSYKELFRRKHEWAAAKRLNERYGIPYLEKVVRLVRTSNGMPYAPVITSPAELEEKMAKLESFWNQKKGKIEEKNKTKFAFTK